MKTEKVQKFIENLEENEPIFILRGKDEFALKVIGYYYRLLWGRHPCNSDDCTDYLNDIMKINDEFLDFENVHLLGMREPNREMYKS